MQFPSVGSNLNHLNNPWLPYLAAPAIQLLPSTHFEGVPEVCSGNNASGAQEPAVVNRAD